MLRLALVGLVNHRRHDHESGRSHGLAIAQVLHGRAGAHFRNPADDGTRPAATSIARASTARFSSGWRHWFSPSEPQTMRPETPDSMRASK